MMQPMTCLGGEPRQTRARAPQRIPALREMTAGIAHQSGNLPVIVEKPWLHMGRRWQWIEGTGDWL
jgi:hypothetical protein